MATIVYKDRDGNAVEEEHDDLGYENEHWVWSVETDGDTVRVRIPREQVVRVEMPPGGRKEVPSTW